MANPRRWPIAVTLMIGLFAAYIDRTNLSVGLPSIAQDLGFAGEKFAVTSSWALTIFLIGYAAANVLGGLLTRRLDPKTIVIWTFAIWSVATLVAGATHSMLVLLGCRLVLGVAEGVYWPQQSRFARAWFPAEERTKANSVIQYYGQFIALAIGFMVLTPIYQAFDWRIMFYATGMLGLIVIVPLYMAVLKPEREAPNQEAGEKAVSNSKLTLTSFGGPAFLLLIFCYVTQGMLFWGITLWIPLAVKSIGFSGNSQAMASSLPYVVAVLLAVPMSILSDRTGKRVFIASFGLIVPGLLLLLLPQIDSGYGKLGLITAAMGIYASSYTPNIWSILQSTVRADAVGPASGIMNGLGAGGGGTLAGFLVGLLQASTGSYMPGFVVLGGLVVLGGIALLAYGRVTAGERQAF